jgi:hypothetical protein
VRLRQILLNLLHNAYKFTERGAITLGAAAARHELHLWVADTGPGVSDELRGQIFEPFVSGGGGPQPHRGIGLGLSISRRLVARRVGNTVLTGRLWDNATARDLIAQLPLSLTFRDFNGVEKVATLPQKLSMDGVPPGDDPFPRDIGYYAPSGVVVFYYDDVGYFTGIVRLGQFDGSVDVIKSQAGNFTARIELAE